MENENIIKEDSVPKATESDENGVSYEDAVFIAVELGEHIMRSGGEISRAEDTVSRICKAYGAVTADVTAIMSVIVVTADFGGISIIGAILYGAFFFFFVLLITSLICLARCFASCND